MQGFTNEELKQVAASSQENLAAMWELFPIPGPVPDVHPSLVWAVLTAALEEGWVELIEDESSPLAKQVQKQLRAEADIQEDLYHLGFMRGRKQAYDDLALARGEGEDTRLVTMTATPDPPVSNTLEEISKEVEATANELHSHVRQILDAARDRVLQDDATQSIAEVSVGFNVIGVDPETLTQFLEAAAKNAEGKQITEDEVIRSQQDALGTVEKRADALINALANMNPAVADTPAPIIPPRADTADERQKALWEVVYALQDMASGDVMPTPETWDKNKPAHLLTAELLCLRFNVDWATLAGYAKLTPAAKRGRPPKK